jgi:methionyl aminopeptidase
MNKKKKKKNAGGSSKKKAAPGSGGGKGFGGAATVLSSVLPKSMTSFQYAGSVLPGIQSPQRVVTDPKIMKPDYSDDGIPKNRSQMLPWVIEQKTPEEIAKMRAAGRVGREVLDIAGRMVKAGINTDEIDAVVRKYICMKSLTCLHT